MVLLYHNQRMPSIPLQSIQTLEDDEGFSFLGDHDKAEIALTLLGLKPGFILAWWEPIDKKDLIQTESNDLERLLVGNQLKVKSIFSNENQSVWCRTFCAHDQDKLTKLIATEHVEGDTQDIIKEKERERGILLGYSKTAVEAYINDESIDDDQLPDSVRNSTEFKFVGSRLSKQNWQKEFKHVKQNIDAFKKIFPNLYDRVVNEITPDDKSRIWNGVCRQVDQLTDRLGMPVDNEIKNVVVGLNLNDITTVSSCGGHVDDGRLAFPWIGCAPSDEPKFRYKNEEKIKETIAKKYSIEPENIFNVGNEAAEKEYYEITRNTPETDEYVEWDKKNAPLENKVIEMIKEYYGQREGDPMVRIALGSIYPGCLIDIPDEDEKKWRDTLSKEDLKNRIKEAQKEMERFGNFLKQRFFVTKS